MLLSAHPTRGDVLVPFKMRMTDIDFGVEYGTDDPAVCCIIAVLCRNGLNAVGGIIQQRGLS